MQPVHVYSIIPKLPATLDSLWFLAHNYWFSWNDKIDALFAHIDSALWEETQKNPVMLLHRVSQARLDILSRDATYLARLKDLTAAQTRYLNTPSPHICDGVPEGLPGVAYFSLEFGISIGLPIYSGGLGILAGDHLKSASDLNVPLIGIGLAYSEGYFRQYMTPDGWQQERYPQSDFEQMPIRPAVTPQGTPAMLTFYWGNRPIIIKIWEAKIGRISLYLLDTNIPENIPEIRQITARLYSGNLEMRLWQEIILGIGGMRALHALGHSPSVLHMNEGHSAFAALERVRELMHGHGLNFATAVEVTAAGSVFTTHTPVPAGNDRFYPSLMQQYFTDYAKELGLSFKEFMGLGRENPSNDHEDFCMPVLALKLSRFSNGVSRLHGQVSRKMWANIWKDLPLEDVPIGDVTNGVHAPTWIAPLMGSLFDQYLGADWRESQTSDVWRRVVDIPEEELWLVHEQLRANLVKFVRKCVYKQLLNKGARPKDLQIANSLLDPHALTIGFARRFATYKRADMLLQDVDSLLKLVSDTDRPVQFIFAGKAHPQDQEGKQLLKDLITLCRSEEYRTKMVFLEDYDMEVARCLVSGCDIWMNNPRRPMEACGTSGMKAMFNGVLQFSTLDGWWDEAWKSDNSMGWAIGMREEYTDYHYQDTVELQTLHKVLQSEIIPDFYDRSRSNIPRSWVQRMKDALLEFAPRFHSHRMVSDYLHSAYKPGCFHVKKLTANNFAAAREISAWQKDIMEKWPHVRVCDVTSQSGNSHGYDDPTLYVGEADRVRARVFTAGIPVEYLRLEVYGGQMGHDNSFIHPSFVLMSPEGELQDGWQWFSGTLVARETGKYGITVRVVPVHPALPISHSRGFMHWAEPKK